MPLFLLHEIFPQGPGSEWFLLYVLAFGLVFLVGKALLILGIVAALARGSVRLGPLDLRGVKPPSIGTWLIALSLCALSATFYASDALMVVPAVVLGPGATIAGTFVASMPAMVVIACLLASVYWTLLLTGARAAWTMIRRRRANAMPMSGAGA